MSALKPSPQKIEDLSPYRHVRSRPMNFAMLRECQLLRSEQSALWIAFLLVVEETVLQDTGVFMLRHLSSALIGGAISEQRRIKCLQMLMGV